MIAINDNDFVWVLVPPLGHALRLARPVEISGARGRAWPLVPWPVPGSVNNFMLVDVSEFTGFLVDFGEL